MICQHGQLQRQCMLCFFEGENIELTQEIARLTEANKRLDIAASIDISLGATVCEMHEEIEQLRADNAALMECIETYAEFGLAGPAGYDFDIGAWARECIAKLGGNRDGN